MTTFTSITEESWERTRDSLRSRIGEEVFSAWFHGLQLEGSDSAGVVLSVATMFLRRTLMTQYAELIENALEKEFGTRSFSITVRNGVSALGMAVQTARLEAFAKYLTEGITPFVKAREIVKRKPKVPSDPLMRRIYEESCKYFGVLPQEVLYDKKPDAAQDLALQVATYLMHHVAGKNPEEIANQLGRSSGVAHHHISFIQHILLACPDGNIAGAVKQIKYHVEV